MRKIRILILEDDLATLSRLVKSLEQLQARNEHLDIALTIMAEYTQVEEYLNKAPENIYDIILLDRDCKACGSFHCLDLSTYPVDKIIGISSVPAYNQELRDQGVTRTVHKDFQQMDVFVSGVEGEIESFAKQFEKQSGLNT